jgi:hypothetical protein
MRGPCVRVCRRVVCLRLGACVSRGGVRVCDGVCIHVLCAPGRCLDIVDPQDVERGPILRLEHEVRSATTADGALYKSCPFFEPPTRA